MNKCSKLLYNLYSNKALLLLTPWIVVILEKLIVTWVAEKCPSYYETQKVQFGVHNSPQYFLSLPLLNEGGCKEQYVNQKGNKDRINMDIREIHYEDVNWTEVVQKEEQ